MQLTFRDVTSAFKIGENVLYQWLNARAMPAVKANDQYYFNSVEVLEWALKNRIALTSGALRLCEKSRPGQDIFAPALMRGGVHCNVSGSHREDVFAQALNCLPLPAHVRKEDLLQILLSREQTGTTGIGNGIAIPHVKHPVIFAGMEPVAGLFFLDNHIDFSSLDGDAVHTLFIILTGSFKGHLSVLSRLAFCLQDENVKAALIARQPAGEILAAFQVAESKIVKAS